MVAAKIVLSVREVDGRLTIRATDHKEAPPSSDWLENVPNLPLRDLVRQIVLNRLAMNEGARGVTAHDLGISLRGLGNMLSEIRAEGVVIPPSKVAKCGWKTTKD